MVWGQPTTAKLPWARSPALSWLLPPPVGVQGRRASPEKGPNPSEEGTAPPGGQLVKRTQQAKEKRQTRWWEGRPRPRPALDSAPTAALHAGATARVLWVPRPRGTLGGKWSLPHGGQAQTAWLPRQARTWTTTPGQVPGKSYLDPYTCTGEALGSCLATFMHPAHPPRPRSPRRQRGRLGHSEPVDPGWGFLGSPPERGHGQDWSCNFRQGSRPHGTEDQGTGQSPALLGLSEQGRPLASGASIHSLGVFHRWPDRSAVPAKREPPPPALNKEPSAGSEAPAPGAAASSRKCLFCSPPTCYSRGVRRAGEAGGWRPLQRARGLACAAAGPSGAGAAIPPELQGLRSEPTWWGSRPHPAPRLLGPPPPQSLRTAETRLSGTRRWGDGANEGLGGPARKEALVGAGSGARTLQASRVRGLPAQPKTKMAVGGAPWRLPLAIRPPAPPGLGRGARALRGPASGAPWGSNVQAGGSDPGTKAACAGRQSPRSLRSTRAQGRRMRVGGAPSSQAASPPARPRPRGSPDPRIQVSGSQNPSSARSGRSYLVWRRVAEGERGWSERRR